MDAQEIFDTVWHAMKAQGRQSLNGSGSCVYHGEDGEKCAVGCLITDEEYKVEMEYGLDGYSAVSDLKAVGLLPGRLVPHLELLEDLQSAHDKAVRYFWPQFSEGAESVAHKHNLIIPENNQ